MANHSRWEVVKSRRAPLSRTARSVLEQDVALAQMIYDLRTAAGMSQQQLAAAMGTTQSVISRLEGGGGTGNRVDTLARVAVALGRHLVISFPERVPADMKDAVQMA